ncbi:hypothetical protein FKM82_002555 [Ascaphus truei]
MCCSYHHRGTETPALRVQIPPYFASRHKEATMRKGDCTASFPSEDKRYATCIIHAYSFSQSRTPTPLLIALLEFYFSRELKINGDV